MERRKFLIGMGAVTAGGTAALGTGALSAADAERDLTVEVVDDSNAYLGFDTDLGSSPDNNYVYAEINNGQLEIDFDTNNAGGQGANPDAVSYFDDVFALVNQGTEPLEVWFGLTGDLGQYLDVYPIAGNDYRETSLVGSSNAYSGPGGIGSVGGDLRIGFTMDLREVNPQTLSGTIQIHADSI